MFHVIIAKREKQKLLIHLKKPPKIKRVASAGQAGVFLPLPLLFFLLLAKCLPQLYLRLAVG